jgi:hypothetical protein
MTRTVLACLGIALVLAFGAPVLAAPHAGGIPAPQLSDPTATGHRLANRFFTLLRSKNIEGLQGFMSDAFQVQRANGTGASKTDFLAALPVINNFVLTDFHGTQAGPALVVRYEASVVGVINGNPYTPGPAPRISTYVWNGLRWQIASNANFNPLNG